MRIRLPLSRPSLNMRLILSPILRRSLAKQDFSLARDARFADCRRSQSIRPQAHALGELAPDLHFAPDEGAEFFGRVAHRNRALDGEVFAHFGQLDDAR